MEEQRRYIIDCSLPRRSCKVQFNNGRSRSLGSETREICSWEALSQRVAPSALLSHWPHDCEHFINWNSNNGVQRDQLSFRLALVRHLTVGREIKWRGRSDFLTKNKPGVNGSRENVRLREFGKHLPVRTTRMRCRQCSTRKHKTSTNMCSHSKVPLCVQRCFEKFHRQWLLRHKNVLNTKCVFRVSLQLLSETFVVDTVG